MAEQPDPVIEAIAQESERRLANLTARESERRDNLRDALNAATGNNKKR